MSLKLRIEAVNAVGGHVFARVFRNDDPHVCGTLFLSMPEWLILTKVLAGASLADFQFTHLLRLQHCDKCTVALSCVTCPLCHAELCEDCWSDHPHAYGIHIKGSTK